MKKNHEHIGLILLEQRTNVHLSLRTIANIADIDVSRLARLESGKYDIYFDEIRSLSIAYNFDMYAELCKRYHNVIDAPLKAKMAEITRKNEEWLNKPVFLSQEHKDLYEAEVRRLDEMTAGLKKTTIINDSQIDDVSDYL